MRTSHPPIAEADPCAEAHWPLQVNHEYSDERGSVVVAHSFVCDFCGVACNECGEVEADEVEMFAEPVRVPGPARAKPTYNTLFKRLGGRP